MSRPNARMQSCVFPLQPLSISRSQRMNLDSLVTRHIQALGGIERVHAIKSFVKIGWYKEGTLFLKEYTRISAQALLSSGRRPKGTRPKRGETR